MTEIQKLMLKMFVHLRFGVGVMGILFPFILVGAGKIQGVPFAGSMSAYYYATAACANPDCTQENGGAACSVPCLDEGVGPMRTWFVGNLFFIGAAMFFIKGFSKWEDWALNVAGVTAPCVALFPMAWPCDTGHFTYHSFHYPSAITFFVCIGFTCVFCSEKTLKEMPTHLPNRKELIAFYRRWYRFLGAVMIVAPVLAWALAHNSSHAAFYLEAAGIAAFGTYWLFKTWELWKSDVEGRAFRGELQMDTRTLR